MGKMIYEIKDCEVKALFDLKDLCAKVKREAKTRVSPETNIFMLKLLIDELGPSLVQKLCRKLIEKGILKWEDNDDFEVEAILDYGQEGDDGTFKKLYLIKWKGWSHEHNTWEPKDNLIGCEDMLEEFHKAFDLYGREGVKRLNYHLYDSRDDTKKLELEEFIAKLLRTQEVTADLILSAYNPNMNSHRMRVLRERRLLRAKRKCTIDLSNKRSKHYKVRKIDQKLSLEEWEQHLNEIYKDEPYIKVENEVDHETRPDFFHYITKSVPMEGIDIPTDPLVGCECEECGPKGECCGASAGAPYAYYKTKKIRLPSGLPIYECNSRCKCGPDCSNRVVQHGRKHKLCIFRTSNNRGWGVKTLQRIPKGSFVMEYVGQIITNEEAEKRGKMYDAQAMTYLFDLDFNDGDCPFTIDAKEMGNIAHFVNHSCDPNLQVFGVWIDHLDPRLPRIALFAKKDIAKDEELTFDYQMTVARYPDSDVEIEDDEMVKSGEECKKVCENGDVTNAVKEQTHEIVEGITQIPDGVPPAVELSGEQTTAVQSEENLPVPSEEIKAVTPESNSDEEVNKEVEKALSKDDLFVKPEGVTVDKAPSTDVPAVTEFNLPATPAPSDQGSDIVLKEFSTPPKPKPIANRIKSPVKRKGNTAFKCSCGAKNCRKYFFVN